MWIRISFLWHSSWSMRDYGTQTLGQIFKFDWKLALISNHSFILSQVPEHGPLGKDHDSYSVWHMMKIIPSNIYCTAWGPVYCWFVSEQDQPKWGPLWSFGQQLWLCLPGWTSGWAWTGQCGGWQWQISPSHHTPPSHSFLLHWLLLKCCRLREEGQNKILKANGDIWNRANLEKICMLMPAT